MNNLQQRLASEVGLIPVYIQGLEKHGLFYFLGQDSEVGAGAQCKYCHTIIWVNSWNDPILSKTRPDSIPASGEPYKKYREEKLKHFLNSMPACPKCGKQEHDLFINNAEYPRFSDGTILDNDYDEDAAEIPANADEVKIWWLEAR